MRLLLSTFFSLAAGLVYETESINTITSEIFASLSVSAQYAAIAYCADNYVTQSNHSIACPSTVCPLLQGTTVVYDSFVRLNQYRTTGLVMIDHSRQIIVVSFRGTHSLVDVLTDAVFFKKGADDICEDCRIHSGFLESWRGVRDIVLNDWTTLRSQYPAYGTIVTGHSLGGALANLCAVELKRMAPPGAAVNLFTFGSPRVGDSVFATYIEKTLGSSNYRVTHLNDPIPRLPGRWLNFAHPGPEYAVNAPRFPRALSADYSTLTEPANMVVTTGDVLKLTGPESELGNYGYNCTDPAMHSEYLGPISGCLSSSLAVWDLGEELCSKLTVCC